MCWQGFLARGLRPRGERDVGSFGGHCPGSTETPEGRHNSERLRHLGPGALGTVETEDTVPLSSKQHGGGNVREGSAVAGKRAVTKAWVSTQHQQFRFAV